MTDDQLTLDDRAVIVTGAGQGLGRSHARLLAERGALVVVNDVVARSTDGTSGAEIVCEEIERAGGLAVPNQSSIDSEVGAADLVDEAMRNFGRIDAVVNNAGILRDRSFHKLSLDEIIAVLDVHLLGSMLVTRAAWPRFRAQGFGRVVNTTSGSGLFGNFGQANYGAAKAGLVGLTKVLAVEGARHGIGVNAIAPVAATQMTEGLIDQARAERLDPAQVSPVVTWLCHPACTLSGEILSVAGGRVARIFIGVGGGWRSNEDTLTVESVRDNLDAALSIDTFAVPHDSADELAGIFDDTSP